jgi:hypothetical protein
MPASLVRTALAFVLAVLPAAAVYRALGPAVEKLTTPACQIEDGSSGPLPCRWDAQHSGNGQGRSFTIEPLADGGRVFRYDDGRVHVEDSDIDPCLLDDQCNPWK